jgi:hypothetical protein
MLAIMYKAKVFSCVDLPLVIENVNLIGRNIALRKSDLFFKKFI